MHARYAASTTLVRQYDATPLRRYEVLDVVSTVVSGLLCESSQW